ncbi:hypothetical protein DT075_02005 [Bacillus licheniformis]|nr:hypothetical protein DT075_02005 [Bacillus licheniformis]
MIRRFFSYYKPHKRLFFIDFSSAIVVAVLELKSRQLLESLGPEASKKLYLWLEPGEHPNYPDGARDDTHFCDFGAKEIAKLVAQEAKEAGIPL